MAEQTFVQATEQANAATSALSVNQLSKVFGLRRALDNVSFVLPQGSFLSIFGPNGAGKSTLLRVLATLTRPSGGNVTVLGNDLREKPNVIRGSIGLISHKSMLYPDLTAEENLLIVARLYGALEPAKRVKDLLNTVELTARRHDVVRDFSRGMTQRVAIARALVHNPKLVLLDEPYSGLDPHAVEIFDALISQIRQSDTKRCFCMVSHDLQKGMALASHLLLLERGRVVCFMEKSAAVTQDFKNSYYSSVGMDGA